MDKFAAFVFRWAPAILWMVLIYYFSSKTRVSISGEFVLNFIFFKTLHILEYSFLYFLLFRGFYLSQKKSFNRKAYFYPLIIAFLYAASDEIHQTLVPTREGALRDVGIDVLGIFFMYTLIRHNINLVKKKL